MLFHGRLIKTKKQLATVGDFVGKQYKDLYFKQIADIIFEEKDFAEGGEFYNKGRGWIPIGNLDAHFMGSFDGNFKIIKGLMLCDRKDWAMKPFSCKGLFGFACSCVIKNVILKNYSFEASKAVFCSVGGLVGRLRDPVPNDRELLITHNYTQGKIVLNHYSQASFAGGIVGDMGWYVYGVISHNIAEVDIISDSRESSVPVHNLGGIVGINASNLVNNRAKGKISALVNKDGLVDKNIPNDLNIGGIAGHSLRAGLVEKNYAEVELNTLKTAEGIVGRSNQGRVENNVSLCSRIEATTPPETQFFVGRIVGNLEGMVVKNNYALSSIKIASAIHCQLTKGGMTKDGEGWRRFPLYY